jgi:hypothetical protein
LAVHVKNYFTLFARRSCRNDIASIEDDGIRAADKSKNPHLKIKRQQRRFYRIKFLKLLAFWLNTSN